MKTMKTCKRALQSACMLAFFCIAEAQDKVSLTMNGREATMSNGILNVVVDQYGRVKTLNYEGDVHLSASIAGASRTPSIKVAINGTNKATWQFPTNDAGIYRSSNVAGRYDVRTCSFAASLLKQGENRFTLTYSGGDGSGVMWDCLKLEAGAVVTNDVRSVLAETASASVVYYDLRGRRVEAPRHPGIYIWRQGSKSGKPSSDKTCD